MNIDELLGIDRSDPKMQRATALREEQESLLRQLAQVRVDNDMTQTDVAREMGVSPSFVSRIESGRKDLHLSTLRRYAFAVGAVVRYGVVNDTQATRRHIVEQATKWRILPDCAASTRVWAQMSGIR